MHTYLKIITDENKPLTTMKYSWCQYLCGKKSKEVKRQVLMDCEEENININDGYSLKRM